jgi:hypothetical protein
MAHFPDLELRFEEGFRWPSAGHLLRGPPPRARHHRLAAGGGCDEGYGRHVVCTRVAAVLPECYTTPPEGFTTLPLGPM